MFREYHDTRIKRNLKIVKTLSLIALILWGICTFTYLFWKWYLYEEMISHPRNLTLSYICNFWGGEEFWIKALNKTADLTNEIMWDFNFCAGYFFLAFLTYDFSKKFAQNPYLWREKIRNQFRFTSDDKLKESYKESSQNNDVTRTMPYTIINFIPVAVGVMLILSVIIVAIAGTYEDIADGVRSVSYHLGIMLLSHIFLIISSGFLIQNCVLIKREWKTNPPPFLLKEQKRAAEQAQKQKAEQDIATCKKLLEECGMLFFIEYYPQLKRFPLRDVVVSDRYLSEKPVRLPAAKKIVDVGLSECALRYIIEKYGDSFSDDKIEQAKTLLTEIENEKGEIQ